MRDRMEGHDAASRRRACAVIAAEVDHTVRGRSDAVSCAGTSDVGRPLRRLRSSRASARVVRCRGRTRAWTDMKSHEITQELATAQITASDPSASAWVSANAGSGKTHVLAQRVIRLLLDGVPPGKILCLTFTKAAAANMANRVFETLGKWTAL